MMTAKRIASTALALSLALAACGDGSADRADPDAGGSRRPATTESAPVSLETVKAAVRRSLREMKAFQADRVEIYVGPAGSPAGPTERRSSWLATAGGDSRTLLAGGGGDSYDAQQGIERVLDPEGRVPDRRGMAPGPPDFTGNRELRDMRHLLLDLEAATVSVTTYEGRPAWLVQGRLRAPRVALGAEEIALTVDRASGMVVRAVGTTDGVIDGEVRLERLVVDPPVDRSAFGPPTTGGSREAAEDIGFRRLPLEQVAAAAGYRPLLPSQLPGGFELAEVAFAERAGDTGSDAHQNPPSRKVVSLAFHRGFERIVVTTRLRGTGTWIDPTGYSADEELGRPAPEKVTLRGGGLDGAPAEMVLRIPELWGRSQLWALGDDLVLTVWGDLGRDEMIALVQSLEPR